MPDIATTIVLPNGGARHADIPDDVPIRDLLEELTSLLELPTVGPDGRPMGYRVDSKALGRELREDETLSSAGVPSDDRLMITTDITAGSISVDSNPRTRRLRKDYELIQELDSRSDLIQVQASRKKPACRLKGTSLPINARELSVLTVKAIPRLLRNIRWRSICTANIPSAGQE